MLSRVATTVKSLARRRIEARHRRQHGTKRHNRVMPECLPHKSVFRSCHESFCSMYPWPCKQVHGNGSYRSRAVPPAHTPDNCIAGRDVGRNPPLFLGILRLSWSQSVSSPRHALPVWSTRWLVSLLLSQDHQQKICYFEKCTVNLQLVEEYSCTAASFVAPICAKRKEKE
jgi:hypothetical protein